jgi:hypothetical protein
MPEAAPFKGNFHLQEALWRVEEAPWVSPVEVRNPNEVTPFPRDGRRQYLAGPWRQMTDSGTMV